MEVPSSKRNITRTLLGSEDIAAAPHNFVVRFTDEGSNLEARYEMGSELGNMVVGGFGFGCTTQWKRNGSRAKVLQGTREECVCVCVCICVCQRTKVTKYKYLVFSGVCTLLEYFFQRRYLHVLPL